MPKILSRVWIVSHRTEMWLLILVAYLFQRNVNSGCMPTKAVDPEAFMNIVSWDFSVFGASEVVHALTCASVYYLHHILYIIFLCGGGFCWQSRVINEHAVLGRMLTWVCVHLRPP